MAGKAGIAYVEIKFNPGDLERMQAEAKANGKIIADDMSSAADKNGGFVRSLTSNWKLLLPVITGAALAVLTFTGNLSILAPILPVMTVALTALLVPFTTLAAVVVGFIPPLTLLAGLLGGLAVAFGLAGARALKGGGIFKGFAVEVAKVTGQFHDLIYTLGQRFLPIFDYLATSASNALHYLNEIAKLPLKKAFDSLATTGVAGFRKFLDHIGKIVAKPIRLAFQVAFGKSDTLRNALEDDWNDIVKFFTGKHGVLLPVEKWFGKQDFTKIGYRWASELAAATISALGGAFTHALSSQGGKFLLGGAAGGAAIGAVLGGPIGAAMGLAIGAGVGAVLNHYWPKITATATSAFHTVGNAVKRVLGPQLWGDIISLAKSFWDTLKAIGGYIANHIYPVVKHVFDALGGWHTVGVIVVGVIRVIVAQFVLAANIVRTIYNALQTVVHWVQRAANAVGGAFTSVWGGVGAAVSGVASLISGIVGDIQTAVGWARSLAGALGLSSQTGNPNSLGPGGGGPGGLGPGGTHHATGGIFTRPTVIGNNLFGEAGREAVLPLDSSYGKNALTQALRDALPTPEIRVFVGNEPVDARVEVAMKRTGRRIQAGRKWSLA